MTALRWCRPQTRALLERWRSDMMDAAKARHITPDRRSNWTVTDQLALSLIFAASPHPVPCQHHSHLHGDTPVPLPQAGTSQPDVIHTGRHGMPMEQACTLGRSTSSAENCCW